MKTKSKIAVSGAAAAAAAGLISAAGRGMFEILVHRKKRSSSPEIYLSKLSHVRVNHPRVQYKEEYEEGRAWCNEQVMEDWKIKSDDGLLLHASFLPAEDARRFVLLSHGYKGNAFSEFAGIARFLHEQGCSLLFIDQRCCGQSEGEYITFGAREQEDIRRWCEMLAGRNPGRLPIYIYGESMGASAVLMASGGPLPEEVKGIIADCGFKSMKSQIRDLAGKWFHLPRVELLLLRMSLRCRRRGGFRMSEADTAAAMAVNERPVLFFHGAEDTYVYPKNSIDNYKRCRAKKELVIVPGARHLCSAYADPGLYRKKLLAFFEKYDSMRVL
jgi:hypothetical protein